jgi:NAD(P)-dependent dehydrogenase (short-subunit alcohol dehydrogenase family)
MRVAVVTGATGPVGMAAAQALADAGHALALIDRTMPRLPHGVEGMALACALADPGEVADAFAKIAARFSRVDVLAHAAGGGHAGALEQMRIADWDRVMDDGLGALFMAAKHAIPLMAASAAPAIVALAGSAGRGGPGGDAADAAAGAAVESFVAALAGEAGAAGIRVNAVAGVAPRADVVAAAMLWLASPEASFVTGATLVVDGGPVSPA